MTTAVEPDARKDELLRILEELRNTPEQHRRHALQKLTKPLLVQVAEVMLRKWEREKVRLSNEIEKRDFHIDRIEALIEVRRDAG